MDQQGDTTGPERGSCELLLGPVRCAHRQCSGGRQNRPRTGTLYIRGESNTCRETLPRTIPFKMGLNLGDVFPDFDVETSQGPLNWYQYIDGSWAILFSHPADFTPVCTTELGTVAKYGEHFASRGVKVAALSCDNAEAHKAWIADIESATWSGGKKVLPPTAKTRALGSQTALFACRSITQLSLTTSASLRSSLA